MLAVLTYLAQNDFLGGGGPKETGGFRVSPTPFVVLLLAGFVIGALGHLFESKTIVGFGIGCIFLATLLIPLALQFSQ